VAQLHSPLIQKKKEEEEKEKKKERTAFSPHSVQVLPPMAAAANCGVILVLPAS
jgi:hypothetical protein